MVGAMLKADQVLPILYEKLDERLVPESKRPMLEAVAERVIDLLAAPDYVPEEGCGFALNESRVDGFIGGVVREDELYDAFPGEEAKAQEALGDLHCYGLVVHRLFRPNPALDRAVVRLWEVEPKRPRLTPIAACRLVAGGDGPAGELLHQIRFWGNHAKTRRDGHVWIVKTAEEWQAETALTRNQYQRALRCLKKHGIVETEQHKSNFYGGKSVTFLRPIYYFAAGPLLIEPQQEEAA